MDLETKDLLEAFGGWLCSGGKKRKPWQMDVHI